MTRLTRPRAILASTVAILSAGCAQQPPIVALAAPPPLPVIPARPVLPAYLGAIVPPAIGPDGTYMTINRGIAAEQAMWHVRAALNVAAIGCRGTDGGAAITAAYNAVLTKQKAALAVANRFAEGTFRKRYGATAWQAAHDSYMTRLYNFFAQPAAKAEFCAAATTLAEQAATMPPAEFAAFPETALPTLEEPFLAVYRQVDTYRTAVATWDMQYGAGAKPPSLAVAALTPDKALKPRLGYANIRTLIAWEAPRGIAIAAR